MSGDLLEAQVFQRRAGADQDEISSAAYNFVIGVVLVWGFAINALIVALVPVTMIASIPFMIFFLGFLASCFYGVWLFNSSPNPAVSFIGYNFVVVPFGLVVNLAVSRFDPQVVNGAIEITGLVTVLMMASGMLFPKVFLKMGGALFFALASMIVIELVEVFLLGIHHESISWFVAIIFCGYIAYDWSRANQIPRTIDNAVDSAAALYMDIINLFLRILDILGKLKKGKDPR